MKSGEKEERDFLLKIFNMRFEDQTSQSVCEGYGNCHVFFLSCGPEPRRLTVTVGLRR